jgi:hypothetical protein
MRGSRARATIGAVTSTIATHRKTTVRLSAAAAVWALAYAAYRGYYAAGGTYGLAGTIRPGHEGEFRLINLAGSVVIAGIALFPVVALRLWSRKRARKVLLAICWLLAVGLTMHALVDMVQRVLSLAGAVDIEYPSLWASVDRRADDLHDLLGNEPWFLSQGLLLGALASVELVPGRERRRWVITAAAATAALTLVGIATMTGRVGRVIVG